jgi:subtilisin family serine protease
MCSLFFLPRGDLKIYFSHLVHVCSCYCVSLLGTVASKTYGIAKNATLIAVKVLNSQGSGSVADIIKGIEWVVAQQRMYGAVINMSLGGRGVNVALNSALANAVAANVTVVVAAGNSNADACKFSPASATNAITVGATGKDDRRASFSNYGSCVDIFAPGVDITSLKNVLGSNWTISGTSMASPHVAGVAALLLQGDSNLTPALLTTIMINDATKGAVVGEGRGSPNLLLYSYPFLP